MNPGFVTVTSSIRFSGIFKFETILFAISIGLSFNSFDNVNAKLVERSPNSEFFGALKLNSLFGYFNEESDLFNI